MKRKIKRQPISKTKKNRKLVYWLFLLPLLLSFIGLIFIFEISTVDGFKNFGSAYFFRNQLLWIAIGAVIMIFFSFFDYHRLYYLAFPLMMVTLLLLFLVLIPGVGQKVGGARRWLKLGLFNFQPTELAKLAIIIYLSSWFQYKERKRFGAFIAFIGLVMFLVFLQPDMGTAIIIFLLGIVMYFLAGVQLFYLLFLIPTSLVGFVFLIQVSPYRFKRLIAFFNPKSDPLGITYHINQILISLSNGGLFGNGFGASRQKFLFLPEAHTDSIFAIIGEELGFIGSFLFILLIGYFLYKLLLGALGAKDKFGKLLAGGIFAFFNLQFLINLGGMVGVLPLTGVPLPFISYGGSSLFISFILMGIMVNIVRGS